MLEEKEERKAALTTQLMSSVLQLDVKIATETDEEVDVLGTGGKVFGRIISLNPGCRKRTVTANVINTYNILLLY